MNTLLSTTGKELFLCGTPEAEEEACVTCVPKMILTLEEEAILKTMREVKAQAKPVRQRLQELDVSLKSPTDDYDPQALKEEWEHLRTQLEGLRVQWKGWERRLDEAIENKLIALGHRDAHS
ncbi:MAG: hypothetical protein AB1646_13875 [Thermodesulfobacteriota bacterium]